MENPSFLKKSSSYQNIPENLPPIRQTMPYDQPSKQEYLTTPYQTQQPQYISQSNYVNQFSQIPKQVNYSQNLSY